MESQWPDQDMKREMRHTCGSRKAKWGCQNSWTEAAAVFPRRAEVLDGQWPVYPRYKVFSVPRAEAPPHIWGWLAVFSTACPPVRVWLITAFKTMEPCEPEAARERQPNPGPRASMTPRVSIRGCRNEREEESDHLSHLVQIRRREDAETSTSAPDFFTDSPLMSDRYNKPKLQHKWHHVSPNYICVWRLLKGHMETSLEPLCPSVA